MRHGPGQSGRTGDTTIRCVRGAAARSSRTVRPAYRRIIGMALRSGLRGNTRARRRSAMKPYTLPDLPYDYAALEPHYSARMLELHHDKHHAAYVKGVNTTLDKLAATRDVGRPQLDRRPREDARVQPLRPRAAHAVLAEPLARRRRPARRRPRRRDRRELRQLRRVQGAPDRSDRHRAGIRLGRARRGSRSASGCSSSRSTTTRATSDRAA